MAILLLFLEVAWKSAVTKRNLPVTGAAPTQLFSRLTKGTDQKNLQVCSDVQQGANFLLYWHHFCVLKIIRQDTKSNIEGKVNTGRTTPKAGAYLRNDKNFIEPLWFSDQSLSNLTISVISIWWRFVVRIIPQKRHVTDKLLPILTQICYDHRYNFICYKDA